MHVVVLDELRECLFHVLVRDLKWIRDVLEGRDQVSHLSFIVDAIHDDPVGGQVLQVLEQYINESCLNWLSFPLHLCFINHKTY